MILFVRNPWRSFRPALLKSWLAFLVLALTFPSFGQTLTWDKQYDGPNHLSDFGVKVKTDASGNVYALANSEGDLLTIKYNAVGVQQWAVRYDSLFTSDQGTSLRSQELASMAGYQLPGLTETPVELWLAARPVPGLPQHGSPDERRQLWQALLPELARVGSRIDRRVDHLKPFRRVHLDHRLHQRLDGGAAGGSQHALD